jgi:hypothetical protein
VAAAGRFSSGRNEVRDNSLNLKAMLLISALNAVLWTIIIGAFIAL